MYIKWNVKMMILNWQPLCLVLLYDNNCWPRHCSYFYTTAQIISGHLSLKSSSDISSSHFVCVLHVCVFYYHVTLLTCILLCLKGEDSIEWSVTRYEYTALRWRHNDHAGVSNHQPHGCLLNRLFRRKSKKTSKLRVTGLCAGNSPGTGEFPAQMASYAENVSIWWRHHGK